MKISSELGRAKKTAERALDPVLLAAGLAGHLGQAADWRQLLLPECLALLPQPILEYRVAPFGRTL
jgi:hypothetical protein